MKYRIVVLILLTVVGSVYAMAQVMSLRKGGGEKVKPVKIYKRHQLADISADGRYILFDLVGRSKKGMKIVEAESGREIARKNEKSILMQLVPKTNNVFYMEVEPDIYKIWDFRKGVTKALCYGDIKKSELRDIKGLDPVFGLPVPKFLNEREVLGTVSYNFDRDGEKIRSELLVKLELPSCKLKVLGDIYEPGLEKVKKDMYQRVSYPGSIKLTADKKQMLYEVGDTTGSRIVVKNTSTFEIEKIFTVEPPLGLSYSHRPTFTDDGSHLILQADTSHASKKKRFYLLVYDAKTFKKLRQFEVAGDENLAVSPNGRFAAVAYKTVEEGFLYLFSHLNQIVEQAHIDLFDMKTGKKVATMSHKKMGEERNVPWIWDIYKMQFTPDGKYLLTSSHRDTYVWDIASLTSNASLTSVQDKQGNTVK